MEFPYRLVWRWEVPRVLAGPTNNVIRFPARKINFETFSTVDQVVNHSRAADTYHSQLFYGTQHIPPLEWFFPLPPYLVLRLLLTPYNTIVHATQVLQFFVDHKWGSGLLSFYFFCVPASYTPSLFATCFWDSRAGSSASIVRVSLLRDRAHRVNSWFYLCVSADQLIMCLLAPFPTCTN